MNDRFFYGLYPRKGLTFCAASNSADAWDHRAHRTQQHTVPVQANSAGTLYLHQSSAEVCSIFVRY